MKTALQSRVWRMVELGLAQNMHALFFPFTPTGGGACRLKGFNTHNLSLVSEQGPFEPCQTQQAL